MMIRFFDLANVSPQENVSYGIPYVNTDFSNVLQDEHLKSYGSYLEGINYGSTSSSEPRNNGIVLSGMEIIGTTSTDYDIGLTNSVIYLNGEFYEKDPTLPVKLTLTNATSYYFYAAATVSEIRLLRDGVSTCTGSQTTYFTYNTSQPSSPTPYIKFQNVGTSRYFRRILKYFTSQVGDIYMTRDISKFNGSGVGFNDMEGFVILDNRNTGYQDIRNRFLRNAENLQNVNQIGGAVTVTLTAAESENHKHTTTEPYWSQTWAPNTERPSDSEHIHFFNAGLYFFQQSNSQFQIGNTNPISLGAKGGGTTTTEIPSPFGLSPPKRDDFATNKTGSIFRYMPVKYFTENIPTVPDEYSSTGKTKLFKRYTGGIYDYQNSELAQHRHAVSSHITTSQPHENRAPYNVLALYTKKIKT